jgi:hypothetical protein
MVINIILIIRKRRMISGKLKKKTLKSILNRSSEARQVKLYKRGLKTFSSSCTSVKSLKAFRKSRLIIKP